LRRQGRRISESLNKYYVGQTKNQQDRIERHNNGREKYTRKGILWRLITSFDKRMSSEAVQLERK